MFFWTLLIFSCNFWSSLILLFVSLDIFVSNIWSASDLAVTSSLILVFKLASASFALSVSKLIAWSNILILDVFPFIPELNSSTDLVKSDLKFFNSSFFSWVK